MTTRPKLKSMIDRRAQATHWVAEFSAKDYDLVGSEHKHTKLARLPETTEQNAHQENTGNDSAARGWRDAQCLRALAALPEVEFSPSTHVKQLTDACTSLSKGPNALFWLSRVPVHLYVKRREQDKREPSASSSPCRE